MARPPKNAMHEAFYQIRDFFIDESMRRVYPKNPYNVLWFMEQSLSSEEIQTQKWTMYKNYYLDCLKNNINIDNNLNPFKEKMIDDTLVLKRVQNIIEENSIDINTLGLATKAVRIMSAPLIEGLLKLGLDPNIPDEINLPLEVALNRKNFKIANVYWNHPLINRFAVNKKGENFAEISIKYKQWKFFEIILADEPQLILGLNNQKKLIVENILKLFNEKKYEPSNEDKRLILKAEAKNEKHVVNNIVPERIRKIIVELIEFCDKKNGTIDITNPIIKNMWREKMYDSFSEKFQENPNIQKVKKLKI